jgi:hypothetical protein
MLTPTLPKMVVSKVPRDNFKTNIVEIRVRFIFTRFLIIRSGQYSSENNS